MKLLTRSYFEELDRTDPLSHFREKFSLPENTIYLDGNSLGARPKTALNRARELIDQEWGKGLIGSWNAAGWWDLPLTLGNKIAHLIGASPGEVVACDTTGINLYKVLAIAMRLRPDRKVIVMEGSNFPTDNYIAEGLVEQLGDGYEIRFVEEDALTRAITDDVAAVCLTHVHYRSGRALDMKKITRVTHQSGALSIWDLCHSAGALEVELNNAKVDFAVGCTYKYLNGGPGSPAFIFMAERHHGEARQPLTGWWGHADPFAFEQAYRPAENIRQMLTGTQSVLSMAVAEVGVDIMLDADMQKIRSKSKKLTSLFIDLLEQNCTDHDFVLQTPRSEVARGSHVSIGHPHGHAIMQALISRGVIGDFRAPDTLRFGFTPLYLRYTDIWDAVDKLAQIMASEQWQHRCFQKVEAVT